MIKRIRLLVALFLVSMAAMLQAQFKGTITLSAPLPIPEPHRVKTEQIACGSQVINESLIFSEKLGLQNVLVFLANIKPDSLPPVLVELRIRGCAFKPRVLSILQGDTLIINNDDNVVHHARGYYRAFRAGWNRTVTKTILDDESETVFNFAFPASNTSAAEALSRAGLIEVRNETTHHFMKAYIWVMPHRVFSLTDEKGEFELNANLPTGKYDMILWHETLGVKRMLVEIKGGQTEIPIIWDTGTANESDSLSVSASKQEN